MSGEIVIRETVPADLAAIVEVHKKGFGYDKEAGLTAELRSEERRVGKECRSRWSPYH